jgi:hypothetical protein
MQQVIIVFDGQQGHGDAAYFDQLRRHPDSYVLNTTRQQPSDYMKLHTAQCRHISQYWKHATAGAFTEREYIKIWGATAEALDGWAARHSKGKQMAERECYCLAVSKPSETR